jgi:DNA gyrase inhibitor GyrI
MANRFDTCNHLDGRCAVPKKKGSNFCPHHCCPVCFGEKSSIAPSCATCAKERPGAAPAKVGPAPVRSNSLVSENNSPLGNHRSPVVAPPRTPGRRDGPALNVTAQDAENLRLMLQKGLLTAEQYQAEMTRLRQMMAMMFERPNNTPRALSDIPGGCGAVVHAKNFELAYKYSYDYAFKKWDKAVVVVSIERTPFAEGNLRRSYRMRDLTKPDGADQYVAKLSKDKYEDTSTYLLDIEMQAMCQAFAAEYNRRKPPKNVEFIEAYLIECFQRPDSPLFACEPFIAGQYVKYSNNWGFVSAHDRNTPHAFSHFTHHISGGKYIVVDVQGVNDKYTDPQMHSFDGKGFGKGNCGQEGVAKFFATHKCNVLCKMLGLTEEVKTLSGTMAPVPDAAPRKSAWDDNPTAADLAYYGLSESDYRLLAQHFRAVDPARIGEIGVVELRLLCKNLNLKVSPKQYVTLIQQLDKDGSGRVTFPEFLAWWTGHCVVPGVPASQG